MRKKLYYGCLVALLLLGSRCFGQVSLHGPSCVTNNTVYLYTIDGSFDSSHTWNLCVTGGSIDGTDSFCINGRWDPFIKISWTDSITGSLQLSSDSGNAVINVSVTTPLASGNIDNALLFQLVDSLTTPASITCSAASGGGCNPSYIYQWQQSVDNMTWTDIPGASGQNLDFTATVTQSGYFRRKSQTQTSATLSYTTAAAIFLNH